MNVIDHILAAFILGVWTLSGCYRSVWTHWPIKRQHHFVCFVCISLV